MTEQLMRSFSSAGVIKLEMTPEILQDLVRDVIRKTIEEVVEAFGIDRQVDLITIKEAMEILKIKTAVTMMSWEEKGYLKPRKISGDIL